MRSPHKKNWLHEQFSNRGIATERVDIALDAWPYNGGTTTKEALWQGVPVLTLQGDRWAARTSLTLLRRAGLSDWVAKNKRSMIQQAIRLSSDTGTVDRLSELRHRMRTRLLESPSCDGRSLTVAMELFYKRVLLTDLNR